MKKTLFFAFNLSVLSAFAVWNGAGTPGGTGTDINDTNNWTGGLIDNNFSTIVSNADLRLTANHNATNGLNFVDPGQPLRHITLSGTNTLTLSGAVPGFPNTRHLFLPSNTYSTVTLGKGLTLNMPTAGDRTFSGNGILFVDALITGLGNFIIGYAGGYSPVIVLRNDSNSFTGNIGYDRGNLHFTSIANKSVPSALGAGTAFTVNNYTFIYIGTRDRASNRDLTLQNSIPTVRNDSASGGLSFTGTVTTLGVVQTDITLGGISSGEALITGNIPNYDTTFLTKLDKVHSGTWRLTGKNTFTGYTNNAYHVSLSGGTLIADYANGVAGAGSNRVFVAGRTVYYKDGRLLIRGKTGAGNTTWQEFGTNTIDNNSFNVLAVDGNGGDGTTVTLRDFNIPYEYAFFRMERGGNAAFRATNAIPASSGSVRNSNGVLMSFNGTRANLLVKDPDGRTGFAAQNAALELVRYTNTFALTADNSSATDHVSLASDLTRTASLGFSTLSVDASANAVTLDLGGFSFQTNNAAVGRGIVVNGSNPVTVRNGTHGAQSLTFSHNYGTGKLSWELTNGACVYVAAGPGLTEFTQPLATNLYVVEGVTRLTAVKNFTEGTLNIFGNGVLEIGADLNGATAGDFSRAFGIGAGGVYFYAGGGFSAYGADRTVNLGGAGSAVVWFADGKPFILSSPYANATLIFQNPIGLSFSRREIRVQNGSAAVDARLTGKIYGYGAAGLIKSGAGTLELTGAQDYRGDVSVIGGGLRLGANDVFAGGTNALVLSSATLDAGTNRNTFATLELLTNSVIEAGNGSATLSFADSSAKTWTGTLTINGKLTATTLRFGADGKSLTVAQLASIAKSGGSLYLDAQGYLRQIPPGTLILVQ